MSSHLVDLLVAESGITRENARKQISRAVSSNEISSIKDIFPKREQFVYLKESYGSSIFWERLTQELLNSNSALGLAISAVEARGGILPLAHFGAASGSPVAMKKKLSYETVLKKLLNLGLLSEVDLVGIGKCVAIKEKEEKRYDFVARSVKARLVTESIFIKMISQWAQFLGLVSYDSIRTRLDSNESPPQISNFLFDITAPSYLSPLIQQDAVKGISPGFFACDVVLGASLTLQQVKPFINKCKAILSLRNVGRCLFVLAATKFESDAFDELKRNGIIPATPENLSGKEMAGMLKELNELLDYYLFRGSQQIDKIDGIMTTLAEVNGASAQLQGALFEYMVAEASRRNGGNIKVGKICKSSSGKKAESDVYIEKDDQEVKYIECKGYKPYSIVLHKDIRHWISEQIPVFYDEAKNNYPNTSIHVELWTTGKLSDESQALLQKAIDDNKVRNRYVITILQAHDVKNKFHATKNKALIECFEKHFISNYYPPEEKQYIPTSYRLAGGPDYIFEE